MLPPKASKMTLEEVLASKSPFQSVLTRWEKENLDHYRAEFGSNIACNLNQSACNFPVKTKDGHTLFCVIHNCGIIWVINKDRWLCPSELALSQGLDVYRKARISTSFSHQINRSRSAYGGQVGNSMCTGIVGSMMPLSSIRLGAGIVGIYIMLVF